MCVPPVTRASNAGSLGVTFVAGSSLAGALGGSRASEDAATTGASAFEFAFAGGTLAGSVAGVGGCVDASAVSLFAASAGGSNLGGPVFAGPASSLRAGSGGLFGGIDFGAPAGGSFASRASDPGAYGGVAAVGSLGSFRGSNGDVVVGWPAVDATAGMRLASPAVASAAVSAALDGINVSKGSSRVGSAGGPGGGTSGASGAEGDRGVGQGGGRGFVGRGASAGRRGVGRGATQSNSSARPPAPPRGRGRGR